VPSILITTPAANNAAFPAVISGSYSLQGGGDALVADGGADAKAAALLVVQITVTLTREDNNSSTNYDATDDGNGQWHLNKPNGLAAVKYTITATMTSPANATHSRTGIQN
jgi:hypothetical protein